jgi:hypothetical protein
MGSLNDYGVFDYVKLKGMLNRKNPKKLGNNTWAYVKHDGSLGIKLYSTEILVFYKNGDIKFNTDSYRTKTTRDRLNRYQDRIRMYQERGFWYFSMKGKKTGSFFNDGLIITKRGKVKGNLSVESINTLKEKKKELKKSVDTYVKGYMRELEEGKIARPDGGDCLICRLSPLEEGHILSHIEEKYYVPSLLLNALNYYSTPFIRSLAYILMSQRDDEFKRESGITENSIRMAVRFIKQMKRSLKKYIMLSLEEPRERGGGMNE